MLVPPARWSLVAPWCTFLSAGTKPVSKDSWAMLLTLMDTLPDASPARVAAYDAEAMWPVLFDEFVDTLRPK